MRILQYCQHFLGIGHYFRSLEISKALKGHEVTLVTGGTPIDTPLPAHVQEVRLPGLMMDRDFTHLYSTDKCRSLDQVKQERRKLLADTFTRHAPDLFIVELYPFGRKALRFELDPLLEGIRNGDLPPSRVVCSLRDILVEKRDPLSYENRVIGTLNSSFHAVLVHADPSLIRLDETFSRTDDISIPVVYTGFITPKPIPDAGKKLRRHLGIGKGERLVIASAGAGRVGFHLLEAVILASRRMETDRTLHLVVVTGPSMDLAEHDRLKSLANGTARVLRFTPDFLSYLAGADLSVSMAGYNTCMNILAARVPALVWPFPQNREQRLRAERLERMGALEVMSDKDLQPSRLAPAMVRALSRRSRSRVDLDLEGAAHTAEWLERWMEHSRRS
jgi:predicted glycosyltransferase